MIDSGNEWDWESKYKYDIFNKAYKEMKSKNIKIGYLGESINGIIVSDKKTDVCDTQTSLEQLKELLSILKKNNI
tara:strand:- start:5278 stop:5502 length:225 start_codon:yes stop_codon:yes gene_type:complete